MNRGHTRFTITALWTVRLSRMFIDVLAEGIRFPEAPLRWQGRRVVIESLCRCSAYIIDPNDGCVQRTDAGGSRGGLADCAADGTAFVAQNGSAWGGGTESHFGIQTVAESATCRRSADRGSPNIYTRLKPLTFTTKGDFPMSTKTLTIAALLATAVTLAACSSTPSQPPSPAASSSSAIASATSSAPRSGEFVGLNGKHVAGSAKVADGQVVLSGFSSDQGPDLHLYLTKGDDETAVAAGKQLGPVVFNQQSQTFAIGGADVADYDTVVVHCDKAKAVFGAAKLG